MSHEALSIIVPMLVGAVVVIYLGLFALADRISRLEKLLREGSRDG